MGLMDKFKESIKQEQEKIAEKQHIESEIRKEYSELSKQFLTDAKKLNSHLKYNNSLKAFGFDFILGSPKKIIKYENLISFELQQDGETVSSGGLGRAIAFGIATGGVGSIVGGVTGKKKSSSINTETKIKIVSKSKKEVPEISYIIFNQNKLKTSSKFYKQLLTEVDEVLAFLQKIIDEETTKASSQNETENISAADEIKKFKDLANSGVITQDEFEAKKKQLLGI